MVSRFPMAARSLAGLVVLAALSVTARADVVVPNSLTATDGNASTSLPFEVGNGNASGRVQMVLDASQFITAFGAGNSGTLSSINFRYDAGQVSAVTTNNYSSFVVKLSQTNASAAAPSTSFATNIGGQAQSTVLSTSGQFAFAAPSGTNFTVALPITNFLYNPNFGAAPNLLIDIAFDISVFTRPFANFLDASTTLADVALNNSVVALASNASTGAVQNLTVPVSFAFTPFTPPSGVPEPGSIALMSVAVVSGLGLGWLRRRRATAAPVAE